MIHPRARWSATITRWRMDGRVRLLAPLMVAGSLGVYVKLVELQEGVGGLVLRRFLGRSEDQFLSLLERLSFIRDDLIVEILVLPLVVVWLLRSLSPARRFVGAGMASLALGVVHLAGLLSLRSVGRYLSAAMMLDAIRWAAGDPHSIPEYVPLRSVVKLLGVVAAAGWLAWLATRDRPSRIVLRLQRVLDAAGLGGMAVALLAVVTGLAAGLPRYPQHRSALVSQVLSVREPSFAGAPLPGTTAADLLDYYRALTRTPRVRHDDPHFGKERGKNVLLFVMETAPRRSLSFVRDGRSLPGVAQLLDRSYVSDAHFTSYPYTSDAIFSLLSGLYPVGRRDFLRTAKGAPTVGLLNVLRRYGYTSLVYSPFPDTFAEDTKMLSLLGAGGRFLSRAEDPELGGVARERAAAYLKGQAPDRRAAFEGRLVSDLVALERLKKDIVLQAARGTRFCAVFMPQVGHGPWYDLDGEPSIPARGRRLIRLQDGWLAEIVAVLKAKRLLEETVIVVTADHGVRLHTEDPGFEPGQISDYSFGVPLLLYAPSTLARMEQLTGTTSHVDITPTILALLGIPELDQYPGQGVPLWQSSATPHDIFFFAGEYLGADGYFDGGQFVAWQWMIGAAYRSASFDFRGTGSLLTDITLRDEATGPIRAMYQLQPRLLRSLEAARSSPAETLHPHAPGRP